MNHKSLLMMLALASVAHAQLNDNLHGYDIVPHDKDLNPEWVESLTVRGSTLDSPVRGSKQADTLKYIGMPVGGISCGTVYLNGDGRLFVWDIFNQHHEGVVAQQCRTPDWLGDRKYKLKQKKKVVSERDGANYINPPTPDKFPNFFRQGFSLNDGTKERSLDSMGWDHVSFLGKWPVGSVDFSSDDAELKVGLKAFSPFIPLNVKDSSYPATIMEYTVQNVGKKPRRVTISSVLENPIGHYSKLNEFRTTKPLKGVGLSGFQHGLELPEAKAEQQKNLDVGTMALVYLGSAKSSSSLEDGTLSATQVVEAGESKTFRFLISWHMPNVNAKVKRSAGEEVRRFYAKTFEDAAAVAKHVAAHYTRLEQQTDLWVKTWYDSSLPQWFMDRAIIPLDTLQTANCYLLENKEGQMQFWAWEGIGACPGTCTHVWHYAQAMARVFPSLERNLREVTDYAMAMQKDGKVPFRIHKHWAWDGQCGTVLRSYREHLMSADDQFLSRNWEKIKLATTFLIEFDKNDNDGYNGIPNGKLHMTLDADWYGKVHELCSLYLAALRAGEEMAKVVGDDSFEALCRQTYEMGRTNIEELFNGEFYIHEEDPAHPDVIGPGKGCYIDQVMGQFWGFQVGLGRIHDEGHIRSSLNSLWKYNFLTDMGPFRARFPEGRFYSVPGDGGMLICTWPKGGLKESYRDGWQFMYFNETQSGYEHQVAAHMVAEGTPELVQKGLAVMRAIHDRYAPHKRNPYNEIECSDHYARAMASYGTFLSACGFEYDGPKGRIGFNPRIGADDFKAPFTSAEGWGTFAQHRSASGLKATLEMKYGQLQLQELEVVIPSNQVAKECVVRCRGEAVQATLGGDGHKVAMVLKERLTLQAGDQLEVLIRY